MKFFVDTADVDAIRELNDLGMVDGVTTNPSIIAKSGRDIKEVTAEICAMIPGKPVSAGGLGYSCLAEVRTVETLLHGAPKTPFLRFGDSVKIEMLDAEGRSIFGAIEQRVERYDA